MKVLRWVPLIALLLSGFGAVYNQGVRLEHRLTTIETKLDMHLKLSQAKKAGTTGRVSLAELKCGHPTH
jgi:hypothetical protein